MAYLTSNLISDAYYLSSIVSREFETPTGSQMSDGLNLLNDVISERTIDNSTIPYTTRYEFNAVSGQDEYPIPNLIDIATFTFYINTIRFQTNNQKRNEFFGSNRATEINSLPFNWHWERNLGGGTLYLYFTPDTAFPMEIWGEFRLSEVTEFQDLSLTLDRFYRNFLKYLLAERLCQFNSFNAPQDVAVQLKKYYAWISNQNNVLDVRQKKLSSLGNGQAINYAVANLGGGYFPI